VTDWSGRDYQEVSGLQRAMVSEAVAALAFSADQRILDLGCGDGFLTRTIAQTLSGGYVIGVDVSPRMIATAHAATVVGASGPWFVVADARRLPFAANFDEVVSFNALHWVPQQREALAQVAAVLRPGGRALIQVVCAGERSSLEATTMRLCGSRRWASWFDGFTAPFVHVEPDRYSELAASAGLVLDEVTVRDRSWDFGSREAFVRWCAVGSGAWTDRLPPEQRLEFIEEQVRAYEAVPGRPGLFLFTQMRARLHR
jgi:trans-aconitate 2-methyltransferase